MKVFHFHKWIWNSYIRTFLIPLIIIELIFICIYFSSYHLGLKGNRNFFKRTSSKMNLKQIVNEEANSINYQLASISNSTMLFRNQIKQCFTNTSIFGIY